MNAHVPHALERLEIIDTVTAYATAVDTRDWPLFASLFTADAVWEYPLAGERHSGPAAILARIQPSIERLDATQHFVSNHVVAVEADTARHTCYFLAQHLRDGGRFLAAGRYEDELRRVDGAWRIAARTLTSTWTEGDPAVVSPKSA